MDFNNIKLWYKELHKWNITKSKVYFDELFTILTEENYKINKDFLENYISICKWLAEINIKLNDVDSALTNYLFIYEKLTNSDFDTLASIGQLYKNIGNDDKFNFYMNAAKEINLSAFNKRIWDSVISQNFRKEQDNSLYLFIISKCKFECCFCDRSLKSYKNNANLDTTVNEIKEIIKKVELENISYISIWWNEPLTNKNIIEILNYLNWLNISIELYTSWSEVNIIKKIANISNIKKVYLPIYSSSFKIHDDIVWKQWAFDDLKIIENILISKKIKVAYNRLLINKNYWDSEFKKDWIFFNVLHPKNEKLYIENSVSLTNIEKLITVNFDNYILKQSIPLCFLINKYIDEDREKILKKVKDQFLNLKNDKKVQNLYNDYKKIEKCKSCSINNYCLWYYKLYFKKFWEEEFIPIK